MNNMSVSRARFIVAAFAAALFGAVALTAFGLSFVAEHCGALAAVALLLALGRLRLPGMRPLHQLGDNSLGSLSGTLVLQRALELAFTQRPALGMISMGFSDLDGRVDRLNLGQTATSRIHSIPTVQDFGAAATDRNDTDVSLTLTGFKQLLTTLTPQEMNSTDRQLVDEAALPLSIALGNHIIDSVAGLWTSRNFARAITVASDHNYDNTLRPIRKDLSVAGVPRQRRFGAFNADVYDNLLGDSMVVSAMNNPRNADAIASGILPTTLGLGIDEYPDLPSNNSIVLTGVVTSAAANTFTKNGHGLQDGDRVRLSAIVTTTGIAVDTDYYVRDAAANTFKVAETVDGEAVDLATNDGTCTVTLWENLIGFAGAPDSTIYVGRPPKNPEDLLPGAKFPGVIGYLTEPRTKFTVMVNQWIGTDLKVHNRLLWLEGYAKGNSNNGVRLRSR